MKKVDVNISMLLGEGHKSTEGNNYHEINGRQNLIQRGNTYSFWS